MIEITQHKAAKIAGSMFLFGMANSMFVELYLRGVLFIPGNFAESAQNIINHTRQFRVAIALEFLTALSVTLLVWAFYVLLKPINKNLALLGAFLRMVEVAFFCMFLMIRFVVLQILGTDDFLKTFEPNQLQALARIAVRLWSDAFTIGFVLLSAGSTVFNYVLFVSNYVPKALAGLGLFASTLFFLCTFAMIIFPELGKISVPFWFGPMFIYEVGLGFWFVIRG
jgi:hypothetical protein